ncbi:MAG: HlyD family efflux transporter periplasmic adaptor subunit [Opitutaceae bacterium]|nr:HlyD family efflux transporter periplasmic adaptor subunit [Opitutaceae bacterium]
MLVAPIGGGVASVATQEGETVSASFSAPAFVTLIDLARLEVWAYVDETDIGRVELGQHAAFTVDTYGRVRISDMSLLGLLPRPRGLALRLV